MTQLEEFKILLQNRKNRLNEAKLSAEIQGDILAINSIEIELADIESSLLKLE